MNVLIVEDDAAIREGLVELVEELAVARAVGDVQGALAAIEAESFDLVLTDLRIAGDPDGGKKIVRAARRHLMPAVILSALSRAEIRHALRETPVDAVVVKPFQLEDVLSVTERYVSRRKEAQRLAARRAELSQMTFVQAGPLCEMAKVPFTESREARWVRLAPGAVVDRVPERTEAALIVEGVVEVAARARPAGHLLHAPAGHAVRLSSPGGALGIVISGE